MNYQESDLNIQARETDVLDTFEILELEHILSFECYKLCPKKHFLWDYFNSNKKKDQCLKNPQLLYRSKCKGTSADFC